MTICGSCLCGGVTYEISGEIGPAVHCHCSQCRKASGSAFAANASAPASTFSFTGGRDLVTEYESTPGKFRAFCARCGSPIYSRTIRDESVLRIRLGTLDDDPEVTPRAHIHVASKAPWHAITDGLPQFDQGPPRTGG